MSFQQKNFVVLEKIQKKKQNSKNNTDKIEFYFSLTRSGSEASRC